MPRPTNLQKYQTGITEMLGEVFPSVVAKREWGTEFGSSHYSPRLDVAVGPFATGTAQYVTEYGEMETSHHELLKRLFEQHGQNVATYGESSSVGSFEHVLLHNANARCFLGIEIENAVTRKHLMGGALNASALSRVALLVGWKPDKVKALVKLRSYLLVLGRSNKPTFSTGNLLILNPDQLWTELVRSTR